MDKQFIKENKLSEAYNRYRMLCEYDTTIGYGNSGYGLLNDDDDDNGGMPQADNAQGADGGQMPMDGGDGMNGGDMGGQMPTDGGADMGGADMGGGMPMDSGIGQGGPEGFAPQPQEELGEEDEVIDVDELTSAQEEAKAKIEDLTSKFDTLMGKLDQFTQEFKDTNDKNSEKIEQLQGEIAKRNPTPVEKLSLRSSNAYPFNNTIEDYWNDKQATSNYSIEDDNNGADEPKYKITKSDVDNISDWGNISKSFDDERIGLTDIFGY